MKLLTTTLITLIASQVLQAEETQITKTFSLRQKIIATRVYLNERTVRCSKLGYGASLLKISVPALDFHTILDHSNIGEAVPCMATSACKAPFTEGGLEPSDLIDELKEFEDIKIQYNANEIYTIDTKEKVCHRRIVENLISDVRGLSFFHTNSKHLGEYPFELCMTLDRN